MKIIEPLLVVFDSANESGVDISKQCKALVRAHTDLIIGFGKGVMPPDFGTEFQPPERYLEYERQKTQELQAHFENKGKPDAININSDSEGATSVMMFHKQQMLKYFTILEEGDIERMFLEMNRNERRTLGKTIKIPLLPLGVTIKKSPSLVRYYNANIRVLLELQKKPKNS